MSDHISVIDFVNANRVKILIPLGAQGYFLSK